MRRRYVWSPEAHALVEVGLQHKEPFAPAVFGDLPGYESPVTGKWIEGKRARREDLKRTGSRPYEGRKVEEQIAASFREARAREEDKKLERAVVDVWQHSPERIRKMFK
jgi:hypothetical protein